MSNRYHDLKRTWYFILPVLLVIGCADLAEDAIVTPVAPVTYQTAVHAVLQAKCVSCHNQESAAGLYNVSSYNSLKGMGSDGVPNAIPGEISSQLIVKLESGHYADAGELQTIKSWIVNNGMALAQPSVHEAGFLDPESPNFHGRLLQQQGYNWTTCSGCHGADLAGGSVDRSCYTCHLTPMEDCRNCHGSFGDPTGAPPADIAGNITTTAQGVGAHTAHLQAGRLTNNEVACGICHTVPAAKESAGHLDGDNIAEVNLTGLAAAENADPHWNRNTATCNNVYCHGDFGAGNQANAPLWTGGEPEAACGSCHNLPPTADRLTRNGLVHPPVAQCQWCHTSVNRQLQIVDKNIHINGLVDVITDLNCTSCHGGLDNTTGAPPNDLSGNTQTSALGVGAHTAHLNVHVYTTNEIECESCHDVPDQYLDDEHLDGDGIAELDFADFAEQGHGNPQWNRTAATCSNIYCHGAFTPGNTGDAPRWTGGAAEADCGTCHGLPPAPFPLTRSGISHPQITTTECYVCHPDVVDQNRNIINKALHIDGQVELNPQAIAKYVVH